MEKAVGHIKAGRKGIWQGAPGNRCPFLDISLSEQPFLI